MASLVSTAAKAAHSTAASLLSHAPVKAGDKLPLTSTVKAAGAPRDAITLSATGKTVIVRCHVCLGRAYRKLMNAQVGVFGAFTPPCSSQAPGYIEKYEEFKAKGVENVYIVTVNDAFVVG